MGSGDFGRRIKILTKFAILNFMTNLADLDFTKQYTYADYLTWQFEERVELLNGKVFTFNPTNFAHQALVGELFFQFSLYLKGHDCRVFVAPFDVRLPKKNIEDKAIYTVLQPDVCVVCDKSKYDFKGCIGAPDIVAEVLSPGNNDKELRNKYDIYEEAGVKEYWVISPQDNTFYIYTLVEDKYRAARPLVAGDIVTTPILPGFSLDLKDFFEKSNY